MKKLLYLLIAISLLPAYAYTPRCADLTGTWIGSYDDHGPFDRALHVKLIFLAKHDHFIGKSLPIQSQRTSFIPFDLQGTCHNNKLQLIFFQPHKHPCGPDSSGKLLASNQLYFDTRWENAMTGGYGMMQLQKINATPVKSLHWHYKKIHFDSCH